jgi:hypothetical protein
MARTPKQSKAQKETVERVMHEFKEGDLRIRGGRKVTNPKQAIAIALHEAGASNQESPAKNRENLRKTKTKERKGETASAGKRTSASKPRSASKPKSASPRERLGATKASRAKARAKVRAKTRADLYAEARRRDIPGRARMSKSELERALR